MGNFRCGEYPTRFSEYVTCFSEYVTHYHPIKCQASQPRLTPAGICRRFLLVFSLVLISSATINAAGKTGKKFYYQPAFQVKDYRGKVVFPEGMSHEKAVIKNLTSGTSTQSNEEGAFVISGKEGDEIEITIKDFKRIHYKIKEPVEMDFVAQPIDQAVVNLMNNPEPVERIYTTVPRFLSLASSDAVYSPDIIKSPVTSVKSTLTGRLAGLYAFQSSGQPGADGVSLSLRGQDPLVIIDGVVANLSVFNLEDVESVTVLKDALGTAMLGVRGSNGALVITTKKGKAGRNQISFTAQTSIQKPIGFPKTLNAYDYASLYNEALTNDGLPTIYTNADLDAYKNHTDPYGHPDVDWKKQVLSNTSRFDRYTLSATGGNQFARYFVALEHVSQSGFFKTVDSNTYNTNNDFKSYVIRSNIDVNVNSTLTGGIYLLGRILNGTEPGYGTNPIIAQLLNTPNNAYTPLNPNGTFGGTQQYQTNILAQTIGSGYLQNYKRDMLTNFYLKQTLDKLTPGLWIQLRAAYNATLSENINRSKSFAVFQKVGTTYNQYGTNGTQANGNGISYQGRTDYEEFSVGYNRTFKNKHGINSLVLVNRDNSVSGSDLPYIISGLSGRFAYNYKGKYMAEATFGYNGSNRYPEGGSTKRGFFPALGVGWNLEKETFLQDIRWLSRLKIYGSYGKTGWDDPGYFTYIQRFFDASGVVFGTSAGGNTAITEQPLANRDITFEKANKLNIGIEGSLLNNKLSFSVDYYYNRFYDLLMQRGRSIALLGNDYPRENIGRNRYTGVDVRLNWQQSISSFQYFITTNASLQDSKVLFADEVYRQYEWMERTGHRVNRIFGYTADGFFQTTGEINSSATTVGYTPQPGDIKYKDLNNDGVIDQFDISPIGQKYPLIYFGVGLGASWKGLDFSALVQGVGNRNIYMGGVGIWPFLNNGFSQAYETNLNRWTPSTAATATYPRLNIGDNPNNQAFSSFWLRNGNYVRLKNIELGYSMPESLLKHVRLDGVRIFMRGYNLVTLTSSKIEDRDPEVFNGFSYPIQKLYNFGINIKL
ncbi:MAG: SusC/RagA family TonB-linked outer membrane protein [Chitinophagaceae bacterium]